MEPGWKQAEPQIVYCCAYTAEGLGVCGLKDGHIFFFGKVKPTTPQECIYRIHGTQRTCFASTKVQILTRGDGAARGSQFTCVTSTKVQTLTQKELQRHMRGPCSRSAHSKEGLRRGVATGGLKCGVRRPADLRLPLLPQALCI